MLADHVTGVYQVRGWWQQMCTLICLFRLYIYNVHKIYKPPSSSTFSKCSDENQVINFMWSNLICNCMNWFDCLDPPQLELFCFPWLFVALLKAQCAYIVYETTSEYLVRISNILIKTYLYLIKQMRTFQIPLMWSMVVSFL
jgi:hypothetical protein